MQNISVRHLENTLEKLQVNIYLTAILTNKICYQQGNHKKTYSYFYKTILFRNIQ